MASQVVVASVHSAIRCPATAVLQRLAAAEDNATVNVQKIPPNKRIPALPDVRVPKLDISSLGVYHHFGGWRPKALPTRMRALSASAR
jgi:hypothetical protein